MTRRTRNIAASHREKLLALSGTRGEDFQFLLNRWIIERFLYRLGVSAHKDRFVLKGATLFVAWGGQIYRPTKDLDLLGFGAAEVAEVAREIREVCSVPADDGIAFAVWRITAERIRDAAEYVGVRVRVPAELDSARISLQIDVGFGDAVEPAPNALVFPTLLPLTAPVIRGYPPEAVVAEKFHAMAVLGMANSRMKDFFDVWTFATTQRFTSRQLFRSISKTFERRQSAVPTALPVALTDEFLLDRSKAAQWAAFQARLSLRDVPGLHKAGEVIRLFLLPLLEQGVLDVPVEMAWEPPGPWSDRSDGVEQ